jgi:hypothetical protein
VLRVSPRKWTDIGRTFEVLWTIKGLKIGKAPGTNGIRTGLLRLPLKRKIIFLTEVFNAVLRRQYFPPGWNTLAWYASELRKDPVLPSSYRPISLLDTVSKTFEEIVLARVLRLNECGLLHDEQFGFRTRHSTAIQLAALLKMSLETLTRGGRPELFSWMWLKPSIPYGWKVSFTSLLSWTSSLTW